VQEVKENEVQLELLKKRENDLKQKERTASQKIQRLEIEISEKEKFVQDRETEMARLREENTKLGSSLEGAQTRVSHFELMVAAQNSEITDLKKRQSELAAHKLRIEEELEKVKFAIQEKLVANSEGSHASLKDMKERIQVLEELNERLRLEVNSLKEEKRAFQENIHSLEQLKTSNSSKLAFLMKQNQDLVETLSLGGKAAEPLLEKDKYVQELEHKLSSLQNGTGASNPEIARLREEILMLNADLKLQVEEKELEVEEKVHEMEKEVEEKERHLKEKEKEVEEKEALIKEAHDDLERSIAEIESLKAANERLLEQEASLKERIAHLQHEVTVNKGKEVEKEAVKEVENKSEEAVVEKDENSEELQRLLKDANEDLEESLKEIESLKAQLTTLKENETALTAADNSNSKTELGSGKSVQELESRVKELTALNLKFEERNMSDTKIARLEQLLNEQEAEINALRKKVEIANAVGSLSIPNSPASNSDSSNPSTPKGGGDDEEVTKMKKEVKDARFLAARNSGVIKALEEQAKAFIGRMDGYETQIKTLTSQLADREAEITALKKVLPAVDELKGRLTAAEEESLKLKMENVRFIAFNRPLSCVTLCFPLGAR